MEAQACCQPNDTAHAAPVSSPTTHIAFFCPISSSTYTMPVTRQIQSMVSIQFTLQR